MLDVIAMAGGHDNNGEPLIHDAAHDPIWPELVTPEALETSAERLADAPWILPNAGDRKRSIRSRMTGSKASICCSATGLNSIL
jgi:hypothetical protein